MKKFLLIFIVITGLISCGEEHTYIDYVFENKSSANVMMYTFKNGAVDSTTILFLNPGDSKVYFSGSNKGKLNKPYLFFSKFDGDSVLTIWNKEYEVLQVLDSVLYPSNRKIIDQSSNRYLGSEKNYKIILTKKRRLSHYFDIIYTFTEEDYNFAKE